MVIVSQPKPSALGALPDLLAHYDTTQILTNGQTAAHDSFRELTRQAAEQSLNLMSVTAGHTIVTSDGVQIMVLSPTAPIPADDDFDDAALVVRVTYGDTSFLIMPELSPQAEQALVKSRWYFKSTVLVLPSHGHKKVNSPDFLRKADPQVAVAMVAAGNRSNLPHQETQERLAVLGDVPLFRTDRNGTIEMVTNGQRLWLYTESE